MSHAETVAFNADLHRYQDQEVAADLRDERIKARVEDMLENDSLYCPFVRDNFQEAIAECNELMLKKLVVALAVAQSRGTESNRAAAVDVMLAIVVGYWRGAAWNEAEKMEDA